MKTLMSFVVALSLAGCSNIYTREDLGDLKEEVVVIWTVDGSHYHLQQWTIDDQGNVSGVGTMCASKSTKFDHPYENPTDFSGVIQKSNIVTVKTSSSHGSPVAVILVVAFAVGFVVATAGFGTTGGFWGR